MPVWRRKMTFGILGYGNLGKAVAKALLTTGDVKASDIRVCDASDEALSLAEKEHFRVFSPGVINRFIEDSDVLCLVVKSYVFDDLLSDIDKQAIAGKQVISFMAGVSTRELVSKLGDIAIACAMPSLAIAQNDGVIAYTKLPDDIAAIFSKFGFAFETEECNLAKVTAFASCGLGFAAYLVDAFAKAGAALGFPDETASFVAAQTFKNACDAYTVDARGFEQTVKAVATPGGITEQGINHMADCNVHGIVAGAVKKSYDAVK